MVIVKSWSYPSQRLVSLTFTLLSFFGVLAKLLKSEASKGLNLVLHFNSSPTSLYSHHVSTYGLSSEVVKSGKSQVSHVDYRLTNIGLMISGQSYECKSSK